MRGARCVGSPHDLCRISIWLCASWSALAFAGQESKPAGGEVSLDPPYVDRSFGFSLRPPAGSTAFREKQFVGRADLELVRFTHSQRPWHLTVRHTTTTRPVDTTTMLESLTRNLSQLPGLKVLRGEEVKIGPREAVRYAASFYLEGTQMLRQQVILRVKPTEFFTLVFLTPLSDGDAVLPLFEQVIDSFDFMRTEARQAQITAALDRGTALLQSVAGGKRKPNCATSASG
jgi:hypothetical protein